MRYEYVDFPGAEGLNHASLDETIQRSRKDENTKKKGEKNKYPEGSLYTLFPLQWRRLRQWDSVYGPPRGPHSLGKADRRKSINGRHGRHFSIRNPFSADS